MLTFPLATTQLDDLIPVGPVKWRLKENQELSGVGSGQILAAELAPSLWEADVSSAEYPHDRIDQLQARIEALDGSIRAFYLTDPKRRYPQYDPDGSIFGSAVAVINSIDASNRAISISGLPASYVLTVGDFFAFDYGTPARRAFHRVVETVAANGSGVTGLFEVRPHIRTGATAGLSVSLISPSLKCIIKPNTLDSGRVSPVLSQLSFSAVQRL